jgi:capsular polysaccharide biosynthesis protein
MIDQGVYSSATRAPLKDASSWEAPGAGHEVSLEVSLFDVLTQLTYRKWLIAKVTATAMLTGVTMCLVLPVRYTATTKIMPPQQTQSTASMMMNQLANIGAGSLAAVAGGGLGLKNPNDIYVGLLNSRPIADAVIYRFGLVRGYRAKDMTAARNRLAHETVVVSEKTGFIAVSVTDKDKRRVAEMANAYTDELRILTKNLAMTEASQRRLFYEDQLKQAKEILVGAEVSFQQVQQRKGLVQLDAQAKAMIESLALLRAQVTAREVEVQALRSYSTEHNPELELAEGELSSLRAEGARMEQRNHSSGFTDLGLGDVPGAGMEYLRAEHELKYRQAMFDLLLKQYDAAKLDESKDAAIIQVVEPAIEPDRRSSLKPPLMILLFTLGGAFAGCLLALLLWWKECLQSDPRMAKQLGTLRSAFIGLRTTISKA